MMLLMQMKVRNKLINQSDTMDTMWLSKKNKNKN